MALGDTERKTKEICICSTMIPPLGLLDRPNTRIQDYSHSKRVKARLRLLMPLLPSYPSSYGLIAGSGVQLLCPRYRQRGVLSSRLTQQLGAEDVDIIGRHSEAPATTPDIISYQIANLPDEDSQNGCTLLQKSPKPGHRNFLLPLAFPSRRLIARFLEVVSGSRCV